MKKYTLADAEVVPSGSKYTLEDAEPIDVIDGNNKEDEEKDEARRIAFERSALFNTRPTVAGIGSALGAGYSKLFDEDKGLSEALTAGKNAFEEGRNEAIDLQNYLGDKYKDESLQGGILGGLVTTPFTAVKGLQGAMKLGALSGVGEAIGSGKELSDIPLDIAAGTAGGAAGYGLGKGISKGYDKTKQLYSWLSEKLGDAGYAGLSKLNSIPLELIKNYGRKTDYIDNLGKEVGDDIVGKVNDSKKDALGAIFKTKKDLAKKIDDVLKNGSEEEVISVDEIINELENVKAQFNPVLRKTEREGVDYLIDQVKSVSPNSKTNLKNLYDIREILQDNSSKAFIQPGKLRANDKYIARAAKTGMNASKDLLKNASPEIQEAHDIYSQIHKIDKVLPRNLFKEGASPASYLAAGSGENTSNRKILQELSGITGQDLVTPARDLATVNIFQNPSVVPLGTTGKTFTQAALGHTLGKLVGSPRLGESLTSPAVTKKILQGSNIIGKFGNAIEAPVSSAFKGIEQLSTNGVLPRIGAQFSRDQLFEELQKKKNPAITQPINLEQAKDIYLKQESGQ